MITLTTSFGMTLASIKFFIDLFNLRLHRLSVIPKECRPRIQHNRDFMAVILEVTVSSNHNGSFIFVDFFTWTDFWDTILKVFFQNAPAFFLEIFGKCFDYSEHATC